MRVPCAKSQRGTIRAMTIEFSCPQCGHPIRAKDEAAGKSGKCKDCGETIRIPSPRTVDTRIAKRAAALIPEVVPRPPALPNREYPIARAPLPTYAPPAPIPPPVAVQVNMPIVVPGGVRKYCPHCRNYGPCAPEPMSTALHVLLTIVTVGWWLIVWILLALSRSYRCPICGSRAYGSMIGYYVEMTVKTVAFAGAGALWARDLLELLASPNVQRSRSAARAECRLVRLRLDRLPESSIRSPRHRPHKHKCCPSLSLNRGRSRRSRLPRRSPRNRNLVPPSPLLTKSTTKVQRHSRKRPPARQIEDLRQCSEAVPKDHRWRTGNRDCRRGSDGTRRASGPLTAGLDRPPLEPRQSPRHHHCNGFATGPRYGERT